MSNSAHVTSVQRATNALGENFTLLHWSDGQITAYRDEVDKTQQIERPEPFEILEKAFHVLDDGFQENVVYLAKEYAKICPDWFVGWYKHANAADALASAALLAVGIGGEKEPDEIARHVLLAASIVAKNYPELFGENFYPESPLEHV